MWRQTALIHFCNTASGFYFSSGNFWWWYLPSLRGTVVNIMKVIIVRDNCVYMKNNERDIDIWVYDIICFSFWKSKTLKKTCDSQRGGVVQAREGTNMENVFTIYHQTSQLFFTPQPHLRKYFLPQRQIINAMVP